ncbi:MAG: nucleoside kinase, partial [Bacteroidales bacterium]|nr:nucleoside kinase [Bacteroidales bacterium]
VNNRIQELDYEIYNPKTVRFIDIHDTDGYRMYMRSLIFVLGKAVRDCYPQLALRVEHSLPIGYYCELDGLEHLRHENPDDTASNGERSIPLSIVTTLKQRMQEIVRADLPFEHHEIPSKEALALFRERNYPAKAVLFETRQQAYSSVYYLDGEPNYFYGCLVPSTGYLKTFDIDRYFQGLVIVWPDHIEALTKNRQLVLKNYIRERSEGGTKLFRIFQEHKDWLEILGVPYVGYLNKEVQEQGPGRLIKISEALQEKKIAQIADAIAKRPDCRLVLISGPSSSGKTTFSKRLSIQLQVLGFRTAEISMDDYFVDRDHTPRDENGDYDFECIGAVDIPFFTQQLNELLDVQTEQTVEMPVFDFISGSRKWGLKQIRMTPQTILIVEGIHGLNPQLSAGIEPKYIFKIFVSALTHIAIDTQNPIRSTDNRLIRRIVRDNNFRGNSALDTLRRWDSVIRGENKNIFPYQENADIMFNSALLFELCVLKAHAEPLLRDVPESCPEYAAARSLLKFLSFFCYISEKEIPPTSILREFLGGSSFIY